MMSRLFLALCLLLIRVGPSGALDGFSLTAGESFASGEAHTELAGLGLQWVWGRSWPLRGPWRAGGRWDLALAGWQTRDRLAGHTIMDLGLTPVLRLEWFRPDSELVPYLEVGIGLHYLSDHRLSDNRSFSTRFQFGDQVGAGVRFGNQRRYELGLQVQHLSNCGLDHPNPGINFLQLVVRYRFR